MNHRRLQFLAEVNPELLPETTNPDQTFRYIDIGSVSGGRVSPSEPMRFGDAPSRARRIVRTGDTIVSTVRTYLRAVSRIDDDLDGEIASTGFAVLRPRAGIDSRYLGYACQSDPFVDEVVARSVGVSYPAINASELRKILLPAPVLDAQRRVADFLDRETARIDDLVARKYALRAAYLERQAAVAHRIITGEGDHNREAVDGLWFSACPSHWATPILLHVATLQRGVDLPSHQRREGEIPIISSGGVSGWHDTAVSTGPGVIAGRYGTIGKIHWSDGPYWPLNTALYVKDFHGNDPRWVYHLLSVLPWLSESDKSAVPGVNRNAMHMLRVPLPPPNEQSRLAMSIDAADQQTQAIDEALVASIDLLAEYRRSVITQAVAGTLDVNQMSEAAAEERREEALS